MLTENSIQQVRSLSITQVISHYLKLDRNGFACCPFHNEKSASFKVTESKGIYKCFGCGESGDAISFVMKQEKMGFIEAIEHIATLCGLRLEYEEVPDKEKYQQQKALRDQMQEVLQFTVAKYRDNLWKIKSEDHPVASYLKARNITQDIILEWQLGWATEEWKHISPAIISKNWYTPAEKLGIVKKSEGGSNVYDGYRSRIIIPITNRHGQYIGIAGRFFELDSADKGKNYPKYINPPQNELYDKSQTLFGLDKAQKAIQESGCAYLVEGYFDVISMHANGHANTIATCGTALTTGQAQLLRRYTNHIVILRDGDAAGKNAAIKDLNILLKAGFKVDIIILPEGDDPDTYIQKDPQLSIPRQDAILWHITQNLILENILDDQFKLGKAKEEVLRLLTLIPNEIIRNNYFDSIIKKYRWAKADLQKQLTTLVEQTTDPFDDGEGRAINNLPKWMDKEHYEQHGYSAVNNKVRTGYYTHNGDKAIEVTNFIITPIFHVYAGKDSRHIIQIDNGKRKAVLDIESKALVSIDLLQTYVVAEGNFVIHGTKPQMLRIASRLLESFPKCMEIKFLGWQSPGFFAFVDKIFVPGHGLVELDEWGVYKHQSTTPDSGLQTNFLVPAASAAFKELQQTGDDPYENDRALTYKPSRLTFSQWAVLMNRVYREKGLVAIAFTILTLFRDIVFDIDNNCPHLYGFGERSSGKSKWAESINAVFYTKRAAFNLNSGTDYAFFAYMQRFINCPANLNEFDEKVIKPEWFQSIKGAFDGESRQRGVIGSKNRTEIMKIRSTLILIGQYLCTMDDNSIVSRSIIEGFNEKEHTDEDKQQYDALKRYEEAGLSHLITDIISLRPVIKEQYRDKFNQVLQHWRVNTPLGEAGNIRIMQNWCHLYTGWHLISQFHTLPLSNDEFEKYCRDRAMHWSRFIRSSDTLSEFWNTIAFLADQGTIEDGWDYKVETVTQIRIRKNRKEEYLHEFTEPTKVLYIRMNNVHKHYQHAFRIRTGKEGMSMENLEHYFSSRKYFLGASKQSMFKRFITRTRNTTTPGFAGSPGITRPEVVREEEPKITSSHVFLYDELGIDIERQAGDQPPEINGNHQPEMAGNFQPVVTEKPDELPF